MSLRRSSRRTQPPTAPPVASAPVNGPRPQKKAKAKANGKVAKAVELPAEEVKQALETVSPVTPIKGSRKRKLATSNSGAERVNEDGELKTIPYAPARTDSKGVTPPTARFNPPRPVQPNQTNATLVTPRGSRVLAHPIESQSSPSKRSGTNTDNLLSTAVAHLIAVDDTGKLKTVIDAHPCHFLSPEGLAEEVDPFRNLVTGIMAQQVSGAAAASIKAKFIGLFAGKDSKPEAQAGAFPGPAEVAVTSIPRLREAGLSQRKAEYIQGLAEKFTSGELTAKMLAESSDEEIMEKLVAVRGLGKWSVEMFAIFTLKRMDFFSTGDLGVQRGMAAYVGKDVAKLKNKGSGNKWKYMSEQDMLDISAKFAPYRSLFMWYMWRIEDVDVSAIQDN